MLGRKTLTKVKALAELKVIIHSLRSFICSFICVILADFLKDFRLRWGGVGAGGGWTMRANQETIFSCANSVGWDPSSIWVSLQTLQVSTRLAHHWLIQMSSQHPIPPIPYVWLKFKVCQHSEVYPCFLLLPALAVLFLASFHARFFLSFMSFHAYAQLTRTNAHNSLLRLVILVLKLVLL